MPVVRPPASLPLRQSDGVTETLAADSEVFGVPVPLRLRRVAVEPGRAAVVDAAGAEVMAYVLAGTGILAVGGERHALAPESMAWIVPPGPFVLVAEAPPGTRAGRGDASPGDPDADSLPDTRR